MPPKLIKYVNANTSFRVYSIVCLLLVSQKVMLGVIYTNEILGMGREEGGGFRMGNTCIPVADSF